MAHDDPHFALFLSAQRHVGGAHAVGLEALQMGVGHAMCPADRRAGADAAEIGKDLAPPGHFGGRLFDEWNPLDFALGPAALCHCTFALSQLAVLELHGPLAAPRDSRL